MKVISDKATKLHEMYSGHETIEKSEKVHKALASPVRTEV
jgi:hypothetical protein